MDLNYHFPQNKLWFNGEITIPGLRYETCEIILNIMSYQRVRELPKTAELHSNNSVANLNSEALSGQTWDILSITRIIIAME